MPSTLFVVKGVESLKSAAEIAFLDSFHDLLEDGEVSLPNGRTLVAPDAGVLIAIDTAALAKSDIFSKLKQADQLNAEKLADLPQLLQGILAAHGRAAHGAAVVTPSSFTGRVRSFIALPHLSEWQRVQLAQVRAESKNSHCSHSGLVAATAANQAAQGTQEEGLVVDSLNAVFRRVADVWMDPHVQNVVIPRLFAGSLALFLVVFAFIPGTMPVQGAYHHPLSVYQNMDTMIDEAGSKPCDVDETGEGRWEGPDPTHMHPKRKHAESIAAQAHAPPGLRPSVGEAGTTDSQKEEPGTGARRRRRSSGGASRPRSQGRNAQED